MQLTWGVPPGQGTPQDCVWTHGRSATLTPELLIQDSEGSWQAPAATATMASPPPQEGQRFSPAERGRSAVWDGTAWLGSRAHEEDQGPCLVEHKKPAVQGPSGLQKQRHRLQPPDVARLPLKRWVQVWAPPFKADPEKREQGQNLGRRPRGLDKSQGRQAMAESCGPKEAWARIPG